MIIEEVKIPAETLSDIVGFEYNKKIEYNNSKEEDWKKVPFVNSALI